MKKALITTFFNDIYCNPPKKTHETNKIVYNHIDEIWSIDLADMIDYKTSNNKGFRYIFILIDKFSKFLWCVPLKEKNSKTITEELSNFLSTSKRSPLKLESDRGSEWYTSFFQNYLKGKNILHFSRFTDKGPSIAERVIRTIRSLLKKPVFLKGNSDWLSELPSVITQYNNTIRSSTKMTPNQASRKSNEKEVYANLKDNREVRKPNFNLGHLFRTADIKKVI